MSFNDMFSNNYQNNVLSKTESATTKVKLENQSNTFVFPFKVYTGFHNITTNGSQPVNARPQNYAQFKRAFTGKEGIVSIWEDSLVLATDELEGEKNRYWEQKDVTCYDYNNKYLLTTNNVENLVDKDKFFIDIKLEGQQIYSNELQTILTKQNGQWEWIDREQTLQFWVELFKNSNEGFINSHKKGEIKIEGNYYTKEFFKLIDDKQELVFKANGLGASTKGDYFIEYLPLEKHSEPWCIVEDGSIINSQSSLQKLLEGTPLIQINITSQCVKQRQVTFYNKDNVDFLKKDYVNTNDSVFFLQNGNNTAIYESNGSGTYTKKNLIGQVQGKNISLDTIFDLFRKEGWIILKGNIKKNQSDDDLRITQDKVTYDIDKSEPVKITTSKPDYSIKQEQVGKLSDQPLPQGDFYYKTIKKGKAFKVRVDSSSASVQFSQSPGSNFLGDYTQWQSTKSFVVDTTTILYDDDLYKLYMIPQITQDKKNDITLLYISDISYFYDADGKKIYNRVVFSSINDYLASTGQTIQQTIQFAAPGEGYAVPKLIYDNTGKAIDYTYNPDYAVDRGIDTIQIEILGPAGFVAPRIIGRPIDKLAQNNKIYPPRPLLMRDIKYPLASRDTKRSNPESTYVIADAKPEIVSSYGDWMERMKATYTDTIQKKFDGWFQTTPENVLATNSNNLVLKDEALIFRNKSAINYDYDVRPNGFFNYVKPSGYSLGSDRINPSKHPRGTLYDMMNLFTFMFNHITTLPIDNVQKIAYSLSQIPLIGGFLNKITLGFPIGWRKVAKDTNSLFPTFINLPIFMSKSLYQWYNDAFWDFGSGITTGKGSAGKGRIPLDMFKTESLDEVGGIIGSGSMSTTFCFRLSDKVKAVQRVISNNDRYTDNYISTLMLGQSKRDDSNKVYLVDETMTVVEPKLNRYYDTDIVGQESYIIDSVGFIGVVKAPVRITMFGRNPDSNGVNDPYDEIVYQVTLQSISQWTNNIRDIHTIYKLSYYDEYIKSQKDFAFPRPISMPNPQPTFDDIIVDVSRFNNDRYFVYKNKSYDTYRKTIDEKIVLFDFADKGFTSWSQFIENYEDITYRFYESFISVRKWDRGTGEEEGIVMETATQQAPFYEQTLNLNSQTNYLIWSAKTGLTWNGTGSSGAEQGDIKATFNIIYEDNKLYLKVWCDIVLGPQYRPAFDFFYGEGMFGLFFRYIRIHSKK